MGHIGIVSHFIMKVLTGYTGKITAFTFVIFLPKMYHLNLITRKHQTQTERHSTTPLACELYKHFGK